MSSALLIARSAHDDADADRRRRLRDRADWNGSRDGRQQPLGDRLRVGDVAHAVEQNRELVAAEPRQRVSAAEPGDRVGRSQRLLRAAARCSTSSSSPARCPRLSLMILKRSTSRKNTAKSCRRRLRLRGQQPLEPIHEQHAIGQAGQRIGAPRRHLRPDARQRDGEVDRLGDVVVGAEIQRFDHVVAARPWPSP